MGKGEEVVNNFVVFFVFFLEFVSPSLPVIFCLLKGQTNKEGKNHHGFSVLLFPKSGGRALRK